MSVFLVGKSIVTQPNGATNLFVYDTGAIFLLMTGASWLRFQELDDDCLHHFLRIGRRESAGGFVAAFGERSLQWNVTGRAVAIARGGDEGAGQLLLRKQLILDE